MSDLRNISVVLPSLNPDDKLLAVVDGLLEYGFSHIIVVNDGSAPEKLHYFEEVAKHPQVQLLHHEVNRGKGAALKTAFAWFLENRPDGAGVVTVDGDNQHHPEDTRACAQTMLDTGNIVLGVRDFSQPDVPKRSRMGNNITCWVFKVFVGMKISDTQTGLRAIPARQLRRIAEASGDRFEYETNMLLYMKQWRMHYEQVKIRTVYIEENKSSHFRAVQDSWRIYKLILSHFFKYTASSLISSVVEWGVFVLLTTMLGGYLKDLALTAAAVSVARLISSLMNFWVNQKLVFKSNRPMLAAFLRYFLLVIPVGIVQMLLTEGTYQLFGITETQVMLRSGIYVAIMVVLFVFNFLVQQRWVFEAKER